MLVRGLALFLLLSFAPVAAWSHLPVGPGASLVADGSDTGTPTNVDLASSASLGPAVYDVRQLHVNVLLANGSNGIQPFLTVGGSANHTVIWVGPVFVPGTDGVQSLPYTHGTEQFTLTEQTTVYAGFDSLGVVVPFQNGGASDHNSSTSLGPIFVGQQLDQFTNPDVGRSYHFGLIVHPVPEPGAVLLTSAALSALAAIRRSRLR